MRRAIQEATLLISVVALALSVWFVIADAENREIEARLGFSLEVEVSDLASDLVVAGEPLPVTVTVAGREADVEAAQPDQFEATISLRNRVAGRHSLPVRVETVSGDVRVRAVLPETVTVVLQETVEREVPVMVETSNPPPLGFRIGVAEATPATAQVSGIASEVEAVAIVVARFDLGGATATIERDVAVEARTAAGVSVSQVVINPRFVQVQVPIEQELFRRTASILPTTVGTPADGFRVRRLRVTPPTIEILVPVDALDDEIDIMTEPIDVGGRVDDLAQQVGLVFADGTAVSGDIASVNVLAVIEPVLTSVTLPIEIQFRGIAVGLDVAFSSLEFARVELRGQISIISGISGPLPPIVIELTALDAGSHRIDLQWTPPPGLELVEIRPREMIVTLAATPTSTSSDSADGSQTDTETINE